MPRMHNLTSIVLAAYAVASLAGCSNDNPFDPDAVPLQVIEGTLALPTRSVRAIAIQINQPGTLRAVIDWNNVFNDIDSGLLLGTCTSTQVVEDAAGCRPGDALVFDAGQLKPSSFDTRVTPGAHTLIVFNFGSADVSFYRLEVI